MWLSSLGRADGEPSGFTKESLRPWRSESQIEGARLGHLAPVLWMSETLPRWERPVSPLGSHPAEWVSGG